MLSKLLNSCYMYSPHLCNASYNSINDAYAVSVWMLPFKKAWRNDAQIT